MMLFPSWLWLHVPSPVGWWFNYFALRLYLYFVSGLWFYDLLSSIKIVILCRLFLQDYDFKLLCSPKVLWFDVVFTVSIVLLHTSPSGMLYVFLSIMALILWICDYCICTVLIFPYNLSVYKRNVLVILHFLMFFVFFYLFCFCFCVLTCTNCQNMSFYLGPIV